MEMNDPNVHTSPGLNDGGGDMSTLHWFPLYVSDWMSSPAVMSMTAEQRGWYMDLLCIQWKGDGNIELSDVELYQLMRISNTQKESFDKVLSKFPVDTTTSKRANQRLLDIYREQVAKHSNASRNGKKGAKARLKLGLSSDSGSDSGFDSTKNMEDFNAFWEVYPKKLCKQAALKAWNKSKNKPPIDKIIATIKAFLACPDWRKEGGQFIPYPSTWLNNGRWDDVVPAPKKVESFI